MSPQDQQDYAAAFNEEQAPVATQTEDEAFGLLPDDAGGAGVAGDGEPAVAIVIPEEVVPAEAVPVEGDAVMPGADVPAEDVPAEAAAEPAPEEVSAADLQREKSWEGRLKKREAELVAREAELAALASEAPAADAVTDEAVQAAQAKLAEDFGDEFVSLILTVAKSIAQQEAAKTAAERTGDMGQNVEALIDEIRNVKERAHFERIYDAHEDFVEVANDPAFQAWVAEDAARGAVVEDGHAREVVALLTEWKAMHTQPEQDPEETPDGDDADGIRSGGGLRLPAAAPGLGGDYADAWKEF